VVSTRNPDARIVSTVRSILASSGHDHYGLCLVDQSDDDRVPAMLGPLARDARLQYLRCPGVGLARGRNYGAQWTTSPFVAFTDDDCVATPGWLEGITKPLEEDDRIGVVFGAVKPAPHDPALGFLPCYTPPERFVARSIGDKPRLNGIGACMAVRHSTWKALHGFDELFGAGAPLRSAEETDFVIRALLAGHFVCEIPEAAVIHSGFRTWAEGSRLVFDYLYGTGATFAKNIKCGHVGLGTVLGQLAGRWAAGSPGLQLGGRPHRAAKLEGFLAGLKTGLRIPVDRATGHFVQDRERDLRERTGGMGDLTVDTRPPGPTLAVAPAVFDPLLEDRSPARLDPDVSPADRERVSIVMPNWNALPFLKRALASLVEHTTFPYELIVVDNGSTDGSKEYIRRFLDEHPSIDATFIDFPENRFFSTACNAGFRAASPKNKYLALYCNDVEATGPTWLQELVEAVQPEKTIAAGHAGVEAITDRQRGVFFSYDPVYPKPAVREGLAGLLRRPDATYLHLYGYCFLLKRGLLQDTGLYLYTGPFTQYHSDWEWYLRWAVMGYRIAPVALKVHHWHSISELMAFYPDLYQDLLERIADPATRERYIRAGRPFYEAESGFRSRYPTRVARAVERLRRRFVRP
jgi:GT2 family glycosyltransferase